MKICIFERSNEKSYFSKTKIHFYKKAIPQLLEHIELQNMKVGQKRSLDDLPQYFKFVRWMLASSLKAFRSLEAYNQMLSGFFCNVQGHIIAFVVLVKVQHSQRMNDALIQVWIITAKDGTINCAHCLGCKAGLTESCSRIASVLFYLEAWTKVNGRLSCTQIKCPWILSRFVNKVEYSRVRNINFKSAKRNES